MCVCARKRDRERGGREEGRKGGREGGRREGREREEGKERECQCLYVWINSLVCVGQLPCTFGSTPLEPNDIYTHKIPTRHTISF